MLRRYPLISIVMTLMLLCTSESLQAAASVGSQAAAILDEAGGSTSLVVVQPGQESVIALNPDTPMTSASLYKVGVMVATYQALAAGTLSLYQPLTITQSDLDFYGDDPASPAGTTLSVADALERMITWSDNGAAGALIARLGTATINAAFTKQHMTHSHMGTPPDVSPSTPRSLAQTTASDQATLYLRLLAGQVVSLSASEDMLARLSRQRVNDRLPALLPPGTVVAHKSGDLDGVQNDAGILFTPRGPVITVVLTNQQTDETQARQAIARVSRLVYDYVLRGGPALPDYQIGAGWFFTQANGRGGAGELGYSIINDRDAQFWTAFRHLGGVDTVGYPASSAFLWHGLIYQVTQKEVFQWRPDLQDVTFLNVFDTLHDEGFDAWLDATKQIPPPLDTIDDRGLTWNQVIARHQRLLDRVPAIKARYHTDPAALNHYGLPMGIKDYGPVIVIRCQRAAFQYWKVSRPWAKVGAVTLVNAGDLAKTVNLFPPEASTPGPAGRTRALSLH